MFKRLGTLSSIVFSHRCYFTPPSLIKHILCNCNSSPLGLPQRITSSPHGWSVLPHVHGFSNAIQRFSKRAEFKGSIIVIDNDNVDALHVPLQPFVRAGCVGFDLEYVPDYYSSIYRMSLGIRRPALIQVASRDICVIYLIYKIGHIPDSLSQILLSDHIVKVSHGAPTDMRLIHRHFGLRARNFVDLRSIALQLKLRPCSLQTVVKTVLGITLDKEQQCSNWEAETLSKEQLQYAATDAWVTLEVFHRLNHTKLTKLSVNQDGDVETAT